MKPEWVRKLADASKTKGTPLSFEKDQILFYQGHLPFGIFLVEDGRIQHKTLTPSGREKIVGDSTNQDVIGLDDLLENKPYTFTAVTLTPSRVSFISRLQVEKLLGKSIGKNSDF